MLYNFPNYRRELNDLMFSRAIFPVTHMHTTDRRPQSGVMQEGTYYRDTQRMHRVSQRIVVSEFHLSTDASVRSCEYMPEYLHTNTNLKWGYFRTFKRNL